MVGTFIKTKCPVRTGGYLSSLRSKSRQQRYYRLRNRGQVALKLQSGGYQYKYVCHRQGQGRKSNKENAKEHNVEVLKACRKSVGHKFAGELPAKLGRGDLAEEYENTDDTSIELNASPEDGKMSPDHQSAVAGTSATALKKTDDSAGYSTRSKSRIAEQTLLAKKRMKESPKKQRKGNKAYQKNKLGHSSGNGRVASSSQFQFADQDGVIQLQENETQKDVFGIDTLRGKFDYRGGVLRTQGSGVVLTVPTEAISKGNSCHIKGKIYPASSQFIRELDLKKADRFVSPVVEFTVNPPTRFKRHLELKIPIASSCESCSSFRVLSIPDNGDMAAKPIPRLDPKLSTPPDMYYEVKGDGFAYVYTKHFSEYCGVCCGRKHLLLKCLLFGKCERIQNEAEADIRVYIIAEPLHSEPFIKVLEEKEVQFGRKMMEWKQIQLSKPALGDEITIKVEARSGWKTKLRRDRTPIFGQRKVKIDDVLCRLQARVVGEWIFHAKNNSPPFECILDVEYSSRKSQEICSTVYIRLPLPSTQKQRKGAVTIGTLSGELTVDEALKVARNFGVDETKLQCLKSDNNRSAGELTVQVLWECQKLVGDKFAEELPAKLRKIGMLALAERYENTDDTSIELNASPEDGEMSPDHQSAVAGTSATAPKKRDESAGYSTRSNSSRTARGKKRKQKDD